MRQTNRTPWEVLVGLAVVLLPLMVLLYFAVAGPPQFYDDNTHRFSTKNPHSRAW
jgi:hypothetical protein